MKKRFLIKGLFIHFDVNFTTTMGNLNEHV